MTETLSNLTTALNLEIQDEQITRRIDSKTATSKHLRVKFPKLKTKTVSY